MCRCKNCGATIPSGTVCTSCDRPFDAAVAEIGRKVRRLQRTGNVASQWGRRGLVAGFIVGAILSLILGGFLVVRNLISPSGQETWADAAVSILCISLLAVSLLPLLFGAIFFAFGAVVKPIFVALFYSVERFEQEFEPPKR